MDFGNIISVDLGLDATFQVTIIATFYPPTQGFTQPVTADIILPLSTLSQSEANFFTIQDDQGGTTNLTLPRTTQKAFIEIYASGNSNEEFWYTNTPDEFLPFFPASTGLIGKGPFREIQVAIDDEIAGVVWPYAVIYSGGITPTNWRPLTAYGTYNQPTYYLDVTSFLPTLANGLVHSIVLRLLGQGTNPSINSNWFVSGSLHLQLGSSPVSGSRRVYDVGPLKVQTTGQVTPGNVTVSTNIMASRHIVVESEIYDDRGLQIIRFEQNLHYRNDQNYTDSGWVQWVSQISHGTTQSTHGQTIALNDEFSYPLSVFSNYSLYEMQFGSYNSAINQTYNRTLQSPFANTESITFSIQHAEGEVGMDDAPGLRHAINGTGATDQKFAFRLSSGESYFRDIEARNDGWVRDTVWGSLKNLEPPVPMNQILPGGGHGFRRRSLDRRTRMKLMK
ncbi:peptide N-acetyl-beta-D-glucosaminyl asparaginase amidase A-domain-containing protein [Abortiporus biennis]|nr:peptide N-acetyl-beta-D-glucosaminyl asparaginase amidase A-domain-containing protein [Abortiporus biennis]